MTTPRRLVPPGPRPAPVNPVPRQPVKTYPNTPAGRRQALLDANRRSLGH